MLAIVISGRDTVSRWVEAARWGYAQSDSYHCGGSAARVRGARAGVERREFRRVPRLAWGGAIYSRHRRPCGDTLQRSGRRQLHTRIPAATRAGRRRATVPCAVYAHTTDRMGLQCAPDGLLRDAPAPIDALPAWRQVYGDDQAVLAVRESTVWSCPCCRKLTTRSESSSPFLALTGKRGLVHVGPPSQ